MLGLHMYVRKA